MPARRARDVVRACEPGANRPVIPPILGGTSHEVHPCRHCFCPRCPRPRSHHLAPACGGSNPTQFQSDGGSGAGSGSGGGSGGSSKRRGNLGGNVDDGSSLTNASCPGGGGDDDQRDGLRPGAEEPALQRRRLRPRLDAVAPEDRRVVRLVRLALHRQPGRHRAHRHLRQVHHPERAGRHGRPARHPDREVEKADQNPHRDRLHRQSAARQIALSAHEGERGGHPGDRGVDRRGRLARVPPPPDRSRPERVCEREPILRSHSHLRGDPFDRGGRCRRCRPRRRAPRRFGRTRRISCRSTSSSSPAKGRRRRT